MGQNNNNNRNNGNKSNNNKSNNSSGKYDGPKHSGASKGVDKNGKQYFRAWNYSKRRGILTAFITTYKSTGEHTAGNGNVYTNLMCKLNYKDSGVEKIVGCLLSHATGKITIPELGMVVNVAAPRGGYFGTFTNND
jgi:hypothetical protein